MIIELADIRKTVMEALGRSGEKPKSKDPWYNALPPDVSTHPGFVRWAAPSGEILKIKVLSSKEARESSKTRATRPHRILVWDELCERWIFAGKYQQHKRQSKHHKAMKERQTSK